jgi:hypothetical protein
MRYIVRMTWAWIRSPAPESRDPKKILKELAKELFEKRKQSGNPVAEAVGRVVTSAVDDQAHYNEFQSSAQESREKLVGARSAAALEFGRPEFAGLGIAGALAAFLGLFLGGVGHGTGLAPWIVTVLAIALGIRVARRLWLRRWHWREVALAEERWRTVLRDEVLRPFLIKQENFLSTERLGLKMAEDAMPVAGYGPDPELAVTSAAMQKVAATARTIASGSIGVSGPRGAGKSTILNKFDTRDDLKDSEQDIRVHVASPVDYNAREFIIHVFTELCLKVQAEAPELSLAAETRRRLNALHFLSTYSSSWGSTLMPVAIFNLTGTRGKERAEQPAGLPRIVAQFRAYTEWAAEWNRSREHRAKGRVIICIDEMDKIRDSSRAEQFLNDIKAIFDIPGCLYLVSISEDAMTVFASQTPAIRTAFDSAFDEIISVAPMTFTEAQDLLDLRITGVPRPFLAVCHVLAGGVPRELIRAARALIHEARELKPEERNLPRVTRRLVEVMCEVVRQEAILQLSRSGAAEGILLPLHRPHWPGQRDSDLTSDDLENAAKELSEAAVTQGKDEWTKMCRDVAVALSFYATVIDLFGNHPGRVVITLKHERYPLIDDLAVARHAMRMNSELAQALITKYRTDHLAGKRHGGK